jgi:hypothetical protein
MTSTRASLLAVALLSPGCRSVRPEPPEAPALIVAPTDASAARP